LLRIILFFLAAIFSAGPVFSQEFGQYSFTHYSVKNGLAAYSTNSVVQDERGYIWIATINGLQRFDGIRFLTFRHNPDDENSLPDNYVGQLLFDKQHNLWVVLGDGSIGIFDTKRFAFIRANVKLRDQSNIARGRRLMQDSEGNLLYIFTFKEVVTYNPERNEFSPAYNKFILPPGWKPTNIVDYAAEKKYFIASDSGLAVYNRNSKELSYRGHNTGNESLVEEFANLKYASCYTVDSKGRFWFYNWPPMSGCSIYCYDLIKKYDLKLAPGAINDVVKMYNEPVSILEQKDGTIWVSGTHVFVKYNENEKNFTAVYSGYLNEQSIYYESLYLFEDHEHNIWVATNNNGIYVFNPSKELFKSVSHLDRVKKQKGSGGVMSFMQLNNGDVLSGCWGDGLYRYNSKLLNSNVNIKGIDEANSLSAWSMCLLNDKNTVCMVGQPAFIGFYDQANGTFKKYEPAIFQTRTLRQVVEDNQGNLWMGSQSRGVYKWSAEKGKKSFEEGIYKIEDIPNTKVLKIIRDSKGFIWVGTETAGVYKIDPFSDSIVDHITSDGPETKRLIVNGAAILEYNDTLMIIAGGGLNFFNTKSNTIRHITTANGLPSNVVVSLEKDKLGYLWIGMSTGLCRMNIEKNTFSHYDREDGMANDNFDIGTNYQLPDGRMLFGTSNDFVVFDPTDVKTSAEPNDVSITEFKILNNFVSVDSLLKLNTIELAYNQNSITISFSNLSYFNKNKVFYYYMLEGIDKEWKPANELNQAVYNYLPSGNYTFKVKTENADRIEGKNITTFKIKVNPPFWKSWWFISLILALLAILMYWIDKLNMKRKDGLQKMRSEIATNLHQEVNLALNNINILSEIARIKADTDPDKSKEYIEQIHARSHNMIIAMDDMLWSLGPENDNMPKTVERMREFIDALKNRYGVKFDILVDEKLASLELNMKLRYEAFLIFREVIRGLVQAGATECQLHFELEKATLLLTMQFRNNCCDLQQLTNVMNRQDMENRLQSIRAKFDMQVLKTHTLFAIRVPVG